MVRSQISPSEFTGWWLRLRRSEIGVDRALLARRAAARGARRITRTLLVDLELGRRQPTLRTIPELALALEMPGEVLAALVLASESIAPGLEKTALSDQEGSERVPLGRRAEGALLSGRFGRAFVLAERAAIEANAADAAGARQVARLVAASAALEIGAPVVADWRARAVFEAKGEPSFRDSAALVFARSAWLRGRERLTRAWLDQVRVPVAQLDRAWRALLEGRLALRARRPESARAELLQAHEAALLAGSA